MARQRTQNAISLFPFLAVLVCTMGALILLLLVTTRRIRHDQQSAAVIVQTEDAVHETNDAPLWPAASDLIQERPRPSLPQQNDSASRLTLQLPEVATSESSQIADAVVQESSASLFDLQSEVDRLTSELEKQGQRRGALDKEIELAEQKLAGVEREDQHGAEMKQLAALRRQEADLNQEVSLKKAQLKALQDELEIASKSTEDGERVLRQRESALISLRKMVAESQQESAAGSDKTVVEFTNSTGTQRSPVIINVTESGFGFLPSGIRVSKSDMEGFPANDNPLLAGVLAIHDHRNPASLTVKPYVLLLVRPSGSLPFYSAQRIFTDANIHFGYELLEEQQLIDAGHRTLQEAGAARQAVLEALNRRRDVYGGLVAEVKEMLRQKALSESNPGRQARVLPDGRIVMPGEDGDAFDGRFYAGGSAKPLTTPQREAQSYSEYQRPFENTAETQENPFAGQVSDASNGQNLAAANGGADDSINSDWMDLIKDVQSERQAKVDAEAVVADAGNPFAASSPQSADRRAGDQSAASLNALANNGADRNGADRNGADQQAGATGPNMGGPEPTLSEPSTNGVYDSGPFAKLGTSRLFGRAGAISGNMGVGGGAAPPTFGANGTVQPQADMSDSANATWDPDSGSPFGSSDSPEALITATDPDSGNVALPPFGTADQGPNVVSRNNQSVTQESTRESSQSPTNWPTTDTATSGQASRTVGPIENSFSANFADAAAANALAAPSAEVANSQRSLSSPVAAPEAAQAGATSGAQVLIGQAGGGQPAGIGSGDSAASDSQLMLQRFLQQVEKEKQHPEADPFLLSLLKQGQQSEIDRLEGRYPVTVMIDQNQLTIGRFKPIDITGWDSQRLLATTLEGLAAEMDRQKPRDVEFALPMIDFRIGRDAWDRQNLLARQLNEMDVPTRSVQNAVTGLITQPLMPSPTTGKRPANIEALERLNSKPVPNGEIGTQLIDAAEPVEDNLPRRRNSI